MSGRLFIGPAGAEIVGLSPDGIPVLANEKGAGEMVEISPLISDFGFSESHEREEP